MTALQNSFTDGFRQNFNTRHVALETNGTVALIFLLTFLSVFEFGQLVTIYFLL